jgi:hypothetical protein
MRAIFTLLTRLAERLVAGKCFRLLAPRHIDNETAADALYAIVGEKRAAEQENVLMLFEIREMPLSVCRANLRAVLPIFLIDDVQHDAVGADHVGWNSEAYSATE